MPLRLDQKKAVVAEVNEVAGQALAAVAAEYRGLKAGEMDALRANARQSGAYLKVVANRLARRALADTEFQCMDEVLQGPVMLGFSLEDPGSAARVINDFGKKHQALQVKAVSVNGELLPASDVERLAKLPTREQALAQLMGAMQAPISKLVRTMAEPQAKLARTMAAVRDQKQAA
jgi:large subunit ribosomal protein L10